MIVDARGGDPFEAGVINLGQSAMRIGCLLKAANTLLLSQPSELAQCDVENGRHVQLEALLLAMEEDLKATAQAIADRYFDHTAGPQLLDQGGRLSS